MINHKFKNNLISLFFGAFLISSCNQKAPETSKVFTHAVSDSVNSITFSLPAKATYTVNNLERNGSNVIFCNLDTINCGVTYVLAKNESYDSFFRENNEYFDKINWSQKISFQGWDAQEFTGNHTGEDFKGILIDYDDKTLQLLLYTTTENVDEYYDEFLNTLKIAEGNP